MDYIVKDSTLWVNKESVSSLIKSDPAIKIGIVREALSDEDGRIFYRVELQNSGKQVTADCFPMVKFGGAHNYEEFGIRGYLQTVPDNPLSPIAQGLSKLRTGDLVVVAYVNGNGRFGVILGGLKHEARDQILAEDDIAYDAMFNGIQTTITTEGEYTLTFHGLPINTPAIDILPAGVPVPAPIFNPLIDGSFLMFDKTGSFSVSDNLEQTITIDKTGANITIESGTSSITLNKATSIEVSSLDLTFDATKDFSVSALQIKMEATISTGIKTTQFAVGNDSFELIDGLSKLIDALGTLIVTSPVGPCSPLMAAPTWAQVELIKTQLEIFKGSL